MKLLLTSNGLVNRPLINELDNLVNKPRKETKFLIVTTAFNFKGGSKWLFIEELNRLKKNFSESIDIAEISNLPINELIVRIKAVDVVYFYGGTSVDELYKTLNKAGSKKAITELKKVTIVASGQASDMFTQGYSDKQEFNLNWADISLVSGIDDLAVNLVAAKKVLQKDWNKKYNLYAIGEGNAVVYTDSKKPYFVGKGDAWCLIPSI